MLFTRAAFCVLFVSVVPTLADEETNLLTKLDCQPAEKRVFDYESNTQLWGPLDENFLVSADVVVHCLGSDRSGKYGDNGLKYMVEVQNLRPSVVKEKQNEIASKRRSKRGVGSWFKQAWVDVKDFFVNLFSKRNKKSDKEFDIAFDFEKQPSSLQYQCKSNRRSSRRKRATQTDKPKPIYDKMFSTPFVFVQLADGSIPEVRFSDKDTDPTVKNFKKHIADTFATQLDGSKQKVLEQSPIGAHFSSYSYDNTGKLEDSLQPTADGQSLKLGATLLSMSQTKVSKQLSVMRDIAAEDMMEIGSNGLTSDPSQVGVSAKQIQQISEGRITTTAGHLTLSLVSPTKNARNKRDANVESDIEDYLKVKTKYSLSMTKRIAKRSTDEKQKLETLMQIESKLNLKGEAIVSESTTENTLREKLSSTNRQIREALLSEPNRSSELLLKHSSDHQSHLYSALMKGLNLEVMLKDDTTSSSITHLINDKIDSKRISEICGRRVSVKNKQCFDLLMILIKAQSSIAQSLLFKELSSDMSAEEKNEIIKLLSQTPNPRTSLIQQLMSLSKSEPNIGGSVMLAVTNLGYKSQSTDIKRTISEVLVSKLNRMGCQSEKGSNELIDTLEAIGNLGHISTIPYSQKYGDLCLDSDSIRIAAIHSCRRLVTNPEVQKWFLKLLKEPTNSCVIKQEVVNVLIEDINGIDMNLRSDHRWPKYSFNEIDNVLSENLIQIKHNECLQEIILRYFERKVSDQSKAMIKKVKRLRSKREVFDSFWTESYCKEYVPQEDKKEKPVDSEASVVVSDRLREAEEQTENALYQKRRKCSATKRLGPNQAQAIFRADIVNDISGPEDYKLMAQFAAGTHFLGKDIDVGKMFIYHKKDSSRAYVNIFGNTLVDVATSDCNGTNIQPYIANNYIPLYDFSLWIVQMTLGVRMDAQMNLDLPRINCQSKTDSAAQLKAIDFNPETKVRASGEVSGKVLVIRGGINVGGDFNYFSNLKLDPSHELCLSVYNGYNPMNVSVSSWYQFWHPSCSEWMDKSVWSPMALNWQINDKHRSAWIENECLIRDQSKINSEKRFDP